jgi:FkbM family methyltransferase
VNSTPNQSSSSPATPKVLVEVLYRGLLGRDPEPEACAQWESQIRSGASIWELLSAFMRSTEYVQRAGAALAAGADLSEICKLAEKQFELAPMLIVDVGAQTLSSEEHVYAPLLRSEIPCRVIGFEPLDHRRLERLAENSDHETIIHPKFIGDGNEHVFYVNDPDSTSSLLPLNQEVVDPFVELSGLQTLETAKVQTSALDDVLAGESRIDLLKLDIQGFELSALQHARQVLQRTAVVHCEVFFIEMYKGQALFSEVEIYLRSQGFCFVDFSTECRYAVHGSSQNTKDQLGWADAVFFRRFKKGQDPTMLLVQGIIASLVYGKNSYAVSLAQRYRDSIRTGVT